MKRVRYFYVRFCMLKNKCIYLECNLYHHDEEKSDRISEIYYIRSVRNTPSKIRIGKCNRGLIYG